MLRHSIFELKQQKYAFRRTMKMASLMCASLSLFVRVAPVSGQVKYTPDTERQMESFTGTLDPWKESSFTNIVRQATDRCEPNTISMVPFDLTKQISPMHTSAVDAFSFSASVAASVSSSLLTTSKHRKSCN